MTRGQALSLKVECPACHVLAGDDCTVPTDLRRRPVKWFHMARTTRAAEFVQHEAIVYEDESGIGFACSCGKGKITARRPKQEHSKSRARLRAREARDEHVFDLRGRVGDHE